MPANTSPIFGLTPNVTGVVITTASTNTSSTGTGTVATNMFRAFTAGANGSYIQKIRFMSTATAPNNSVATTLRIFISSIASGATTAADTSLSGEIAVPIIATDNATNSTNFYDFPLNIAIPTNNYIYVSQHTAQTNTQWIAVAFGSDY